MKKKSFSSKRSQISIINSSFNRHIDSHCEKISFNGKIRTIIHVHVKPTTNSSIQRNSSYLINSSHQRSTTSLHRSISFIDPITNSNVNQINPFNNFTHSQTKTQILNNKQNFGPTTKDLTLYYKDKKKSRYSICTIPRCLCLLCCIFSTLLLGSAIAAALLATLIKTTTSTTSSEGTTIIISNKTTSTAITTTTSTIPMTISISTTQTTTLITTTNVITTTIIPPATNVNVSTNIGNYYGYVTLTLGCTTSLSNVTIQIVIQKTVNATYAGHYDSFSNITMTSSYLDTGTQIIYTWTIITGQTIYCVSAIYNVAAQFNLVGTPQITSADTFNVITTTTGGVTNIFTGNF